MTSARSWFSLCARFVAMAALSAAGLLTPLSLVAASPASVQTNITVTTTAEAPGAVGDCTLGEAIQAANSNAPVDACPAGTSSDLIVLAPGASYTLTTAASAASAFVISSTITLQGQGARLVRDPLPPPLRFFSLTASSSLTLIDVTLAGGLAQGQNGKNAIIAGQTGGDGEPAYGGAIYSLGGALTLNGATFTGNRALGGHGGHGHSGSASSNGGDGAAAFGGAIFANGPVTFLGAGARFIGNQVLAGSGGNGGTLAAIGGSGADALGGAIYVPSSAILTGVMVNFEDNLVQGGSGGSGSNSADPGEGLGGAVYADKADLTSATFFNNRAEGGNAGASSPANTHSYGATAQAGALHVSDGLTLINSSLVSNTAQGGLGPNGGSAEGGGLVGLGVVTLRHTLLLSNTALGGAATNVTGTVGDVSGGGLLTGSGHLDIDQSALVANTAQTGASSVVRLSTGGGLEVSGSFVTITNTTIALNRADVGGGLRNYLGATLLTHATVYSNAAGSGGGLANTSGTFALRNSLVADNAGGNCSGTVTVAGDNLQFPGGTCGLATVEDPLLSAVQDNGGQTLTAALPAGSPALDLADPAFCPAVDQRGLPRPAGAACDLGAYERWLSLYLPLVRR